ncbi:50S ribosomal protein like [Heracleum sosnowskyi]|uniref:50S ribosomal protein like n=1 Tax=Heracleum sosnowskyi TaxID=360622 RepID=A0AAD8ND09_9APIA|nr:50S ribosomal protein like [Heracleum sosnowskyi]
MVVSLGPGKFYGSSLPRPRFYTDVRFNEERVDPPGPVLDSLMSWAEEAHWSMGGLNVKRLRFQGRIEGNMDKIKAESERSAKNSAKKSEKKSAKKSEGGQEAGESVEMSPEAPPAPFMVKRKRRFLVDEDESDGEESGKRGAVRKLGDDFEKVAEECGLKKVGEGSEGVATRSRSGRSEGLEAEKVKLKGKKWKSKGNGEIGARVSPRLAKRG